MKQLSMNDFLMESRKAYEETPPKSLKNLFNDCLRVVEIEDESIPIRPVKLSLEVGMWIRLNNGNVYQIEKLGKPSKVFCGMRKKQKKDGTFYYERVFKEEISVIVTYYEAGKEIKEMVYETDILMTSFFMIDCIFKADRIFTDLGNAEVLYKRKTKNGTLLGCLCKGRLMVFKQQDITGTINECRRGNLIRNLSAGDSVCDRFHGWGKIINVTPYKVFVKSPNFKFPYTLAEIQITDYNCNSED